jgi:hypothetical protein
MIPATNSSFLLIPGYKSENIREGGTDSTESGGLRTDTNAR